MTSLESQAFELALFEHAPDAILLVNSSGQLVRVNGQVEKLFGYEREELLGKPLEMLIPARYREQHVSNRSHYSEQPRTRSMGQGLDLFALRKDGSEFPVDIMLSPVQSPDGTLTIATIRDITERKQSEEALKQLMQQREDYVATLTHDLKTPLLAANRAIKLLLDGDFGKVSDQQAQILQTIAESNEATYKLVRTLLDVYRYDSGAKTLVLDNHNLSEEIGNLLQELRPIANMKGVSLTVDTPSISTSIACDIEEIRRVVQNLVDNAVKFTGDGGVVNVRIEHSPGKTTVTVSDNGKGIPEHEKSQLFQRFWQPSGRGRNYASTGLGLYLCRRIIEMHGGKIWCDSSEGNGSTFYFTLPPEPAEKLVSNLQVERE